MRAVNSPPEALKPVVLMLATLFAITSRFCSCAQEQNLEVIANNVANINTTGFNASGGEFTALIYQTERLMAPIRNAHKPFSLTSSIRLNGLWAFRIGAAMRRFPK